MTANLSGDFRSTWMTSGMTSWRLDTTLGRLVFDDASAQTRDAEKINTQGTFSKLTGNLLHIQSLNGQRELMMGLRGQWASGNLDPSQKMQASGPSSVRAYAAGALSGDTGYLLSAELRQPLGFSLGGRWTATAFVDTATMTINQKKWTEVSLNKATLSGVGLGLNWAGPNQYTGTAYVATPIGSKSPLTQNARSTQLSIEIQKRF
jgi:hemolysin activation/secretion protein